MTGQHFPPSAARPKQQKKAQWEQKAPEPVAVQKPSDVEIAANQTYKTNGLKYSLNRYRKTRGFIGVPLSIFNPTHGTYFSSIASAVPRNETSILIYAFSLKKQKKHPSHAATNSRDTRQQDRTGIALTCRVAIITIPPQDRVKNNTPGVRGAPSPAKPKNLPNLGKFD